MAWKVWFDDGTTYANTDGAVATIPNKGIVAAAVNTANVKQVYAGQDFYIYTTSFGFGNVTLQQLLYQVCNNVGNVAVVRQGALVDDTTHNNVMTAANAFIS